MTDESPHRPWTEADTLEEAVEALHHEVSRGSDAPHDWFARQLDGIRDLPTEIPTLADAPEAVEDIAPSAKLVWLHLRLHGPATEQAIAEGTRLSKRTTRYGLRQLEDVDAVESEPNMRDARQDYYTALSGE